MLDEPGTPTEQLELQARELVDRFLRTRTLPVQRCPMELFEAMLMQRAEINMMLDELYRRACSRWLQKDEDGAIKRDREGIAKVHGVAGVVDARNYSS